jgi:hypothetical protein
MRLSCRTSLLKTVVAAVSILAGSALPAHAGSITIDSTNCNSSAGCYGLSWTLTVTELSAPTLLNGIVYDYSAQLDVADDTAVAGTPTVVISAVDFKVSNDVSGADLLLAPISSSGWSTAVNVLTAGGCASNPNPGFVCSDTSTDPANFTASSTAQTWIWLFNPSSPLFTNLDGAHIGAKMTDLSNPGKLLSASFSVPEPGTLALLVSGLIGSLGLRARRRTRAA